MVDHHTQMSSEYCLIIKSASLKVNGKPIKVDMHHDEWPYERHTVPSSDE
jgi:hypothetical protein